MRKPTLALIIASVLLWPGCGRRAAKPPPAPRSATIPSALPEAENAATEYLQAAELLSRGSGSELISNFVATVPDPRVPVPSTSDVEPAIQMNARVFALVRKGLAKKDCEFPRPRSGAVVFPSLSPLREIARLLVAEGKVAEERGRPGEALSSYLDCVRFGAHVGRRGILLHRLTGSAIVAIARPRLCLLLDSGKLGAADRLRAVRSLEASNKLLTPTSVILREERELSLAATAEAFDNPGKWSQVRQEPSYWWILLPGQKRRSLAAARSYYDALLRECDKPYPYLVTVDFEAMKGSDPAVELVALEFGVFSGSDAKFRAILRGMLLLAAVHAYKSSHGEYPASLADLKPEILKAVPNDPFSEKPFRYGRSAKSFYLYSIGPDLRDDKGKLDFYRRGGPTGLRRTGDLIFRAPE